MRFSRVRGYKFKLEEDEKVLVPLNVNAHNDYISLDLGVLIIKFSYLWDGSSIPFKKFVYFITFGKIDFDKYCKIASLVHDSFSQLMREGLLDKKFKELIDGIYRDMCIKGRMEVWEEETKKKTVKKRKREMKKAIKWAERRYLALRKFGDPYIRNIDKRNKIFEI